MNRTKVYILAVLCGLLMGAIAWGEEEIEELLPPPEKPLDQSDPNGDAAFFDQELDEVLPDDPQEQTEVDAENLPSLSEAEDPTLSSRGDIFIKGFDFKGNTVFSDEELREVLVDYVDRNVTIEELESARKALSFHYINNGFATSGALLPDQEVQGGRVFFQLLESRLSGIEIEHVGKKRLYDFMIRAHLKSRLSDPFNINDLQDSINLLNQNPTIRKTDAELRATGVRGESILELQVKENNPWDATLLFENHRSPSIGAERLSVLLANHSLLGFGDRLSVSYGITSGELRHLGASEVDHVELSEWNNISASYTIPLNGWGTTLSVGASKSDSVIIEDALAVLDIRSRSTSYFLELRHPLYKTLSDEYFFSLKGERKKSRTFLGGQTYSFSDGAEDGVSCVTVIRAALRGTHRTTSQVFSGRLALNVGIDALGATTHQGELNDGRFISFQAQGQYVRRVGEKNHRLIVKGNSQLTEDRLLSLEQFSIGGSQSVRGYRENKFLRDQGVTGSVEFRYVLWANKEERPVLELAPFYDVGYAWKADPAPDAEGLESVGVGALFHWKEKIDLEVYWGHALRKFDPSSDLQDSGWHFSLQWQLF